MADDRLMDVIPLGTQDLERKLRIESTAVLSSVDIERIKGLDIGGIKQGLLQQRKALENFYDGFEKERGSTLSFISKGSKAGEKEKIGEWQVRRQALDLISKKPEQWTEQISNIIDHVISAWKGCDLCLMSELSQNKGPESGKLYLEKQDDKLKYIAWSAAQGNSIVEGTIDISVRGGLTKAFLNKKKVEILEMISKRGHTPFGQNLIQLDFEELIEHLKKLKARQSKAFESLLIPLVKTLKLSIPEPDNFTKILLRLLKNKLGSRPIGCDFYTVEVASEQEVTLRFCEQQNYKQFIPLLIKQKGPEGQDKIWVYGHKKLEDQASRRGNSELLQIRTIEGLTLLTPEKLTSLTPALAMYKSISFGKEKQPERLERGDYLFEIYHDVVTKGGHFTTLSDDFFADLIPTLAKELPLLRQSNQEQFCAIVDKVEKVVENLEKHWTKGAFSDLSAFSLEEYQEDFKELLKKTQPLLQALLEAFPDLQKGRAESKRVAESKEQSEARERGQAQSIMPPDKIEILLEAVSSKIIEPKGVAESKEQSEARERGNARLVTPPEKIEVFLEAVFSKVKAELEALGQEKAAVKAASGSQDYKRLSEIFERSEKLILLREEVGTLKLSLQSFVIKHPTLIQKNFSSIGQNLAKFKDYSLFIRQFKSSYSQLISCIESGEREVVRRKAMLFSSNEGQALKRQLLSQLDLIKKAIDSDISASSAAFFSEAMDELESTCREMVKAGVIEESLLRTIQAAKQEWGDLHSQSKVAFASFKAGAQGREGSQSWSAASSLDEAIELLIEHLVRYKEAPQSKEFLDAKAQLDACLTAWKLTELYKRKQASKQASVLQREVKVSQEQQAAQEQKVIQEQKEAAEFSVVLAQHQEHLKSSNKQIMEYLKSLSQTNQMLGECLATVLKNQQAKMLSPSAVKQSLVAAQKERQKYQSELHIILGQVARRLEYFGVETLDVREEEQALISGLISWQQARKEYEVLNALSRRHFEQAPSLPQSVERKMAVEGAMLYAGPRSLLEKAENEVGIFLRVEEQHRQFAQKVTDIIEGNNRRLSALGSPQEACFSIPSSGIPEILTGMSSKKREEMVRHFREQVIGISLSYETVMLDYQQKIEITLGLNELMRSTYAKLRSEYHALYCLNLEIESIIDRQSSCAEQIEQMKSNPELSERLQALGAEQQALSEALTGLKQKKERLLEKTGPGTLAELVFELRKKVDKLIGKKALDETYWSLQSIPMTFKKTDSQSDLKVAAETLIFKKATDKEKFEFNLQAFKVQLIEMQERIEFAKEYLKEVRFVDLSNHTLNPKKYLAGVEKYAEELKVILKRFESCHRVIFHASQHAEVAEELRRASSRPDALAMALDSADKGSTQRQTLAAQQAVLQARNFRKCADDRFDSCQEELGYRLAAAKAELNKRLEASYLHASEYIEANRRQHVGSEASLLEAEANDALLSRGCLLYTPRTTSVSENQRIIADSASQIKGAVIFKKKG